MPRNLCVLFLAAAMLLAGCATSSASPARTLYYRAEKYRKELSKDPSKRALRQYWVACADRYMEVYRKDPTGPWAAAALFSAGNTYRDLYRLSGRAKDRAEALDLYQRVHLRYPKSAYAPKARAAAAELGLPVKQAAKNGTLRKDADDIPVVPPPAPDPVAACIPHQGPKPGPGPVSADGLPEVLVTGIRFWTSENYTRVVIDADGEAAFYHHLLRKDPKNGKPPRLFVDLFGSRVSKDLKEVVTIDDDLLSAVRAAQHDPETVRVVVDIKSFESYKVFPLKNPFRVVIDVRGTKKDEKPSPETVAMAKASGMEPGALARQLALKVDRIVIDPGHGGKDCGAVGALGGVYEKDVVLSLAKRLKAKLEKKTGCEVLLTRDTDKFLSLEERTALANSHDADLFVSIHTNAHKDRSAYGMETYILNLAADDESIMVAARENATSRKSVSDLQGILQDLMTNAKIDESTRLASAVQRSLVKSLKQRYSRIKDKGVKQAPFYVLLGARMPAILVETSFISNPRECKRLTDSGYQDALCEGIARGIQEYVSVMNFAAR
ncbi:MAG: N-acetylmuramoyl-L-alanine amidase [Deltaproteobacteria bacterium]|nr:N-acetylmuramoyl-L-alanine amidase [Deltaproteobacteria bacterium]